MVGQPVAKIEPLFADRDERRISPHLNRTGSVSVFHFLSQRIEGTAGSRKWRESEWTSVG